VKVAQRMGQAAAEAHGVMVDNDATFARSLTGKVNVPKPAAAVNALRERTHHEIAPST